MSTHANKKALLDTDTVSEIMRAKNADVLARAEAYQERHGALSFSALTVFEILQGLHRLHRTVQIESFRVWLEGCEVLELDTETASIAGEIAGAMTRTGRIIGVVDTCIAAAAIRHDRLLVTGNERHYESVRAAGFPLVWENWRAPLSPAPTT